MPDDQTCEYQEFLEAAFAVLAELPSVSTSNGASPATRVDNRELIKQIQERMIYSGQLDPVSLSEELETVALHVRSLQPDDVEIPLLAEYFKAADNVVATIKQTSRKPVADGDLKIFIHQVQSAVDEVPTPSSSQARDLGDLAVTKTMLKDWEKDIICKGKLPAPAPRKPNKNKPVDPDEFRDLYSNAGAVESLEVEQVLALFVDPEQLSKAEGEMQAVTRTFGGVMLASEEDWIKAFEHLKVFEHDEFSSRITTSSEVTGDRNLERRLRRRHQLLSGSENTLLGHQIAHGILDKINAILFATDYNSLSPTTKKRWVKEHYFEWSKSYNAADGYKDNANRFNNGKTAAEYKKWRRTFSYSTTARNRLLTLYKYVGHLNIFFLHFIEPTLFWLQEHSAGGRHSLFHAVGQKMITDSHTDDATFHLLSQLVEPAERALLCIMQAVSGVEGRARVQAFLNEFADKVFVQRSPA
ncbi:hypothetical protein FIBSPDRAFT_971191 [Athelia psychrophila]|uniref:Uncharacterized protein n=1 Tax=Athelia psychrophila TaxID=1759441 RepID=A0A166X124_9AGAM|nr:hypothetical protein FIBSPDRAFT_971191 [Fibularhizoctonia sp. CBS 109695]